MTLQNGVTPWYKQRWPWLLMVGPGVVIVAGVVTVWLAIISNDGLVTDDYYKQGLAVNQSLKRDHVAANLGLHADLMRSGLKLRLLLGAQDSKVELPEVLILKIAHPTRSGLDQSIKMISEGEGFYAGGLSGEISGRWLVSLEEPAGQWRLNGEWVADSSAPLRIVAKAN